MAVRRRPIDTVPILLKRLEDIKGRSPHEDRLLGSVQKIEEALKDLNDKLLPQFKYCEDALVKELNELGKCIDDDVFDNLLVNMRPEGSSKIDSKIKSVDERIEGLKNLRSQIQLPEPETQTLSQQRALEARVQEASEYWSLLEIEKNVLVSPAISDLQQSYDVLDVHLKVCLLCLAIFPEKAVIKKKPLVYWWIGEGLISKSKEKPAVEVGEGIFMQLIEKGMIEPFYKGLNRKNPIVDACTVHPWIRRVLISVATRAEFFDFDATGKVVREFPKSYRACLVLNNQGFSGDVPPNDEKAELLTVFNVNEQYMSLKLELFQRLSKLETLQLGRWQDSAKHHIEVENDQFLNELGAQRHLKYVSLQGISRITALPSSIVGCVSLEILDLRACHNLESLPSDIGAMRKLTHLDVSECYLLESMPKGIEKLSSLQVLKGFVIGHLRRNPCKLGDLAHLKNLRKLSILGSDADIGERELAKLKDIANLRILTITWGGVPSQPKPDGKSFTKSKSKWKSRSKSNSRGATSSSKKQGAQISFPPELEKLDLRCFPHRMSPLWLTPSNLKGLKRLYIRGGELDHLVFEEWKVNVLRLKYLKNLKVDGSHLKEGFPELAYFEKTRCNQIDENLYENDVEWRKAEGWEALQSELVQNN